MSVEKWCEANKIYSFEGAEGVRNFRQLCEDIGYDNNPIEYFLSDNPGAITALLDFIDSHFSPSEFDYDSRDRCDDKRNDPKPGPMDVVLPRSAFIMEPDEDEDG